MIVNSKLKLIEIIKILQTKFSAKRNVFTIFSELNLNSISKTFV